MNLVNIGEPIGSLLQHVVNRIMWLTGGVKFPIHFMAAERNDTRPGITAAGRMMTEGEDFYWYKAPGGRVFVLAKW